MALLDPGAEQPPATGALPRATLAIRVALGRGDVRSALREVIQLSDDLQRARPPEFGALVAWPPELTGDARFDALVAAVVDAIVSARGEVRPTWLNDPARTLGDPWDVEPVPALRAAARELTPGAVARHGIYLDPAELRST